MHNNGEYIFNYVLSSKQQKKFDLINWCSNNFEANKISKKLLKAELVRLKFLKTSI